MVNRAEQDRALFARYLDKRDPVDREMLVERFLPLARQLARRYQHPEEPFDDLFQVACLGLVKAIDRFDLERDRVDDEPRAIRNLSHRRPASGCVLRARVCEQPIPRSFVLLSPF